MWSKAGIQSIGNTEFLNFKEKIGKMPWAQSPGGTLGVR